MRRLTILVDADGICADLLQTWLEEYNRGYNDCLTKADIKDWDLHKSVKPECGNKVYGILSMRDLYKNIKPLPGAQKALRYLTNQGHNVIIATASANQPQTAADKLWWLKEHFKIGRKQVFIGHQKELIKGDVFIDDKPATIEAYRQAWGQQAKILTIAYPYNEISRPLVDLYAEGWHNTERAWDSMVAYIDALAR